MTVRQLSALLAMLPPEKQDWPVCVVADLVEGMSLVESSGIQECRALKDSELVDGIEVI
jgi:hypothetical protein